MNDNNYNSPPSNAHIVLIGIAMAVVTGIVAMTFALKEPRKENNKPESSLSESVPYETYVPHTSPPTEPPTTKPAGFYPDNRDVYCVGDEYAPEEYYMSEGVYMLIANSGDHEAYFHTIGTDDENWQEMEDCNFQYSCIVKLEKGWDFMPAYCDAYSFEYFDNSDMENNPFEHGGMFRVGTDVPAGTYKVISEDDGIPALWTVHENIDSIDYDKIHYDHHDEENNEITLKDGEILEMQYCYLEEIAD